MKFDSPLFDRIRVKPKGRGRPEPACPVCEWAGCEGAATHRAPKGRAQEGAYWRYCLDHVRLYNQSYNYFAGMKDDAVQAYQKDALTGHRPTWRMGMNTAPEAAARGASIDPAQRPWQDPFRVLDDLGGPASQSPRTEIPEKRLVRNAERKAFGILGLEIETPAGQIKIRFKELVKLHHPDVNGGDRSSEDRLRDVIQAYNYLRSVGFC
jgi:curved DNA-binding protein CbpA